MDQATIYSETDPTLDNLFRELNRFRMTGDLCDAVLSTNDGASFRVHKIVMSLCSDYFRTLFTTSLVDKSSGEGSRMYFRIPDISSTILEKIIKYAYSGIVDISASNINSLLPAADQFNVPGIVDECINFILQNMNTENCIGIWRFGKDYYMPLLKESARRFIMKNFCYVSMSSKEFLDLSREDLKELLSDDSLNVPSERSVWLAIKRWCQYKYVERHDCIPYLLTCVRMALLPMNDFQQIMYDPRVYRQEPCRSYINMVSKYFLNELENAEEIKDMTALSLFAPRNPYQIIIVAKGLVNNAATHTFEAYDCRADIWKCFCFEDYQYRMYHQMACIGKYIYLIGGSTAHEFENSCRRIDSSDFTSKEICPMQEKRSYLSVAVLNGKVYALGGFNGINRLRTVERYDDHLNQWSHVSPMHEKRSDASASSLRNRIFIVGGYNGETLLQSAECYYGEVDQWFLLPSMEKCRSGVGCVALDNAIYAIGGYNGESRMDSVEKYSMKHRQWVPVKHMEKPRSNFATAVLENKIYVMGGYNENASSSNHVECYDPKKNQWRKVASLNIGRTGVPACTISDITEMYRFISPLDIRNLASRF